MRQLYDPLCCPNLYFAKPLIHLYWYWRGSNYTCNLNGALSLFDMNFSLKQLVGFTVVMVAAGLLRTNPA